MVGNAPVLHEQRTKVILREHREALARNPAAYTEDLKRVIRNGARILKKCGYPRVTMKRCPELVSRFVSLIFEAQDHLPLFHVPGPLPYCWNAPKHWHVNYIMYEWGHLNSKNQSAKSADQVTNFCLLSARCNQHVQTSMDIEEVLLWLEGSRITTRVRTVLSKREALFCSELWLNLLKSLEAFR
jgi:hypothetical protein